MVNAGDYYLKQAIRDLEEINVVWKNAKSFMAYKGMEPTAEHFVVLSLIKPDRG